MVLPLNLWSLCTYFLSHFMLRYSLLPHRHKGKCSSFHCVFHIVSTVSLQRQRIRWRAMTCHLLLLKSKMTNRTGEPTYRLRGQKSCGSFAHTWMLHCPRCWIALGTLRMKLGVLEDKGFLWEYMLVPLLRLLVLKTDVTEMCCYVHPGMFSPSGECVVPWK